MPTELEAIHEIFFENTLGRVRLEAAPTSDLEQVKQRGFEIYVQVNVTATAINTPDLQAASDFANAIIKACAKARRLNAERGL